MPTKRLSIIIPTYNRCDILDKTLTSFGRQTAAKDILEILVVDDGSTDNTFHTVSRLCATSLVPIRYLQQSQRGVAAARNHGLREAVGDLILFCDDDIVPERTMVAEHLTWQQKYPEPAVSIMGRVVWSPEVYPTPFMKWFGSEGPLFSYKNLRPGAQLELYRSYFNNTSVKAAFLRQHGTFDEELRRAFEDIELAYRLRRKGWRLLYNPDAVGYHYKFVTFAGACARARMMEELWKDFEAKEAGMHWKRLSARTRSSKRYKMQQLLVRAVVPLLAPMKRLMDSYLPLPWSIYRAFYHYYKSR